jgi:hypothetical protein
VLRAALSVVGVLPGADAHVEGLVSKLYLKQEEREGVKGSSRMGFNKV